MTKAKARQQSTWRPTTKLLASSIASFAAVFFAKHASEVGWDFTPDDAAAVQTLIESALIALVGGFSALAAGWLKSPSESDGIVVEASDGT